MAKKPVKGTRGARKPKCATETKADAVETRTAGETQYSLPAESKVKRHLANAEAWEAKLTELKIKVKKAYEVASGDGVTKKLLKDLMALKNGDPMARRQALEAFGIGLKVIGAPFQMNIFDTIYESDIEQARADARMAAKAGRSPECRFSEGSAAHDAYQDEYMRVQASMVPGADKMTPEGVDEAVSDGKQRRLVAEAFIN